MSGFGLLGDLGAYKSNLLNLRQQRQEVIAANIANADTPGYKAKRVDFEDAMAEAWPRPGELAMGRTSGSHLPSAPIPVTAGVQAVETAIPKGDKNSVDLEQEMARMTANQVLYNYAIQSMSSQINGLKLAISGGQ